MTSERRIALCVGNWASDSTLYAWTFTRQSLLRRVPTGNGTQMGLDPRDKLFIVHVGDRAERRRTTFTNARSTGWDAGGPLIHSLEASLSLYEHTIVELHGNNLTSTILEWATENNITLIVMGLRKAKGSAMIVKKAVPGEWGIGSLSDAMLQHTKLPLLVVQADAVRTLGRIHLRSDHDGGASISPRSDEQESAPQVARTLSPPRGRLPTIQDEHPARKPQQVAIVTEGRAGPGIALWAAQHLLQPTDLVHVLHVLAKSDRGNGHGAAVGSSPSEAGLSHMASFKSLERSSSPVDDPTREAVADGADVLQDFNVISRAYLKGDAKDKLLAYAEEHPLDILVIGRSMGSRLRKALTPGGTVSQYLVTHAPCPTLVLPYKALEPAEPGRGDLSPEQVVSPRDFGSGKGGGEEADDAIVQARARLQQIFASPRSGVLHTGQAAPQLLRGLSSDDRSHSVESYLELTQKLSERDSEIATLKEELRLLRMNSTPAAPMVGATEDNIVKIP